MASLLWCAAAATALLINKQGSPLEGATWWAMSTAFSQDGSFEAAIVSQGYACASCQAEGAIRPLIMVMTFRR